jgi:CRISPR-associated protein Csy2
MSFRKILLLPHVKIHNANALSSPFTIGFPAMTAWLGASHALQRKLIEQNFEVTCNATGIVSHQFDLQTYRGTNDFVSSIVGTGNPLDKSGERSPFIEEARCHLEVSLIIEIEGVTQEQYEAFENTVAHILHAKMKIAGGDICTFASPKVLVINDTNEADLRALKRKLMPGYVLIERRDLMIEAMEQGEDAMDAMLNYLAIHHTCEKNKEGEVVWAGRRKSQKGKPAGWIVPIATGFHGISELGEAKNQRDPDTPHRFAESLVTLGEFKMPHRFSTVEQMLWSYQVDSANSLYQCVPTPSIPQTQENEFI